ncbi:unnamed protein product [Ceutorhynchus assimilis]|uniref:Cytochrome P450 n=1 Tax=Ceutorhynchus assimilis TaxID=467358 RepID=A0A9N9QRB6_9CUCU|nr:unnamed protein product [Ceutorhynchus assimilis]
MLFSVTQILIASAIVLLSFIAYLYSDVIRARRKLAWVPQIPRVPFLGSIFELGDLSRILSDFLRITNNVKKMAYYEVGNKWVLVVKNYDLLEFILTSTSTSLLTKSKDYVSFQPWLGNGLLTAPGPKWKKRRKVITPAFHFSILEQFVDIFESNLDILIKKLENEAVGKPKTDLVPYITTCTLDNICETAMGVRIEAQSNKNQDYVNAVKDFSKIAMARAFSSWKTNDLLFKFSKEYKLQNRNMELLHGLSNSVIEKRKQELQNNKNVESLEENSLGKKKKLAFLDLMLKSTIDGQPLTQEEIREEVDTFMFAGHDTTSWAIAVALYLLSNHPEVQKKVREEQREIFGKKRDRTVTYQDLQNMKYLEVVIKETLRLYPSLAMIGRLATDDINFKGNIIPKNTLMTLFIFGINRDPDYYENPEEFKPERFLDSTGKHPYAYIPFSAGPRNCIGQKFALLEVKSTISGIIRNFELHPTNPTHKLQISSEAVLKSLNGIMVRIEKHKWE